MGWSLTTRDKAPTPPPSSLTNHGCVTKYSNRENIKQANLCPWLLDFQVSARTFSNKMRLKDFRPLAATVELVTQCCSGGQVAWQGITRLTFSTFSTHYRCVGDKNHTGICPRRVHNSRNCHPRPQSPASIGSRNVMTELKNVKKKTLLTFQDWSLEAAKWGENKTLLDTEIQWKVIRGARTCKEFQTGTLRSSNEWSRDRLRRSPFVECFLTSNTDVLRASSRV